MSAAVAVLLLLVLHLAGAGGGWVDLSALALLALGWGLPLPRAAPAAWAAGLLLDASSLGPLGLQALLWLGGASALAVEQRVSHRGEVPTLLVAAGLSALWLGIATALLAPGHVLGGEGWGALLLRSGGTALAAPLLLAPLRAAWSRRRGGP